LQRKNITLVLPTAGHKSSRHLEGCLEFFAHLKIFIYLFHNLQRNP